MRLIYKVFFIFLFFIPYAHSSIPEPPDIPYNYVTDLAGIIDDETESRLNAYLKELEEKTTAQIAILTILSLDGEDIESFSLRIAEKWKLGKKGKDNGLLLTVAIKDRKYRFEVGYGLEPILPDSVVGSIGREHLVLNFRKGDYSKGILEATLAIVSIIAKHEGVRITGIPEFYKQRDIDNREFNIFFIVFSFIILILLFILFLRHPRLMLLLLVSTSIRGGRGSWYSGGGFGGGGFGGFSGGGGGFGGGGASGRW
jgi:uncharacterized protein